MGSGSRIRPQLPLLVRHRRLVLLPVAHPVAHPEVAVVEVDVVVAEAEVAAVADRRVWTLLLLPAKSPAQCSKVAPILKSRKAQQRTSKRSGTRFVSSMARTSASTGLRISPMKTPLP